MTSKQINIIFIVALVAFFGLVGLCDLLMSKAYFEGQKDAINGDVRIAIKDSVYIWTKSCWDDGTKPLFNPTKDDTYN